ncbi:MAG: ABC transporter ATP-binding protein [Methyloversatilis sp.]|uniref:ABC transporter ATP-binding protein n=1 Tax=Methyloversatilis sp. TaxID=2569862 RepID=UPI000DB19ED5|nr:ABC transporter ATP-binding protein [Methyloversatilis sp.]MCR6665377.1 ABC transporter ATP-binding protein [Methyloversatilis sp.]PZU55625.1 MAG: ABC transporter ATP-binding protein [Thauera sp.]
MSDSTAALLIEGVCKRFGSLQALDNVTLEVKQGEFFGLLGPNGAGKTTLISAMAGLCRADSGSIRVLGHDTVTDYRAARARLGVVPQELVFDPFFTVRETLRIQSGYFGLRRNDDWIDEILQRLDLEAKADVNMRRLSGGMKRRVLVAQALVHRPPLIVLDEPTAGVDVELRQGLWAFVRDLNKQGHTIVLTTHYLEEAESLCGRIAMLKQGRVVALERTADLLSRRVQQTLRLRLGGGAALPAEFRALARATPDGRVAIVLDSADDVAACLARLRAAGVTFDDIELAKPDLEDVFIAMMQDAA